MPRNSLSKEREDSPVIAYLAGLKSDQSKRTMRASLRAIFKLWAGDMSKMSDGELEAKEREFWSEGFWMGQDAEKADRLKSLLLKKYAGSSASLHFTTYRGVIKKMLLRPDLIEKPDAFVRLSQVLMVQGIEADQGREETGRKLKRDELERLAKVCWEDENRAAGSRDDAIIGLGVTMGPRIAEITNIQLEDYDPDTGEIIIRMGKGGKTRIIRAINGHKNALDAYLEMRGSEPGALFCRIVKDGVNEVVVAKLSTNAIRTMLQKRAKQAEVKKFMAHDMRRTFVTDAYSNEMAGPEIQKIAGHSSEATTAKYDRGLLKDALDNAENKMPYPSGWGSE